MRKRSYSLIFLAAFCANSAINIFALYNDFLLLEQLTKPLIILFLMGFYLHKEEKSSAYLFFSFPGLGIYCLCLKVQAIQLLV